MKNLKVVIRQQFNINIHIKWPRNQTIPVEWILLKQDFLKQNMRLVEQNIKFPIFMKILLVQ